MKNPSQTQHHRSETKRKEEHKIKEIRKKEDAGCRMQDAGCRKQGVNGTVAAEVKTVNFTGIAKISQGLQKFCNHSEIFAILAKFSLCEFFARLAKFR